MTTPFTPLELVCRIIREGWSVTYYRQIDVYEWRRPDGISDERYQSKTLLDPPYQVLLDLLTGEGRKP